MSINKIFVPEKKELKQFLKSNGSELFYSRYVKKADALIGSSKSIDYIDKFINKYSNENDSVFFELD
jgi:hypothetical protein